MPSTVGTSGQILQSTGGSAAWVNSTTLTGSLNSTATVGWRVLLSPAQAITTGAFLSIDNWSTEVFDTDAFHSTDAGATSQVTITVPGHYIIGAQILTTDGGTTGGTHQVRFVDGAASIIRVDEQKSSANIAINLVLGYYFATSGSTISLDINIVDGTTSNISSAQTAWWGYRVGP